MVKSKKLDIFQKISKPVSYTHLDVYKRQVCGGGGGCDVTATTLTISAPAHTTVGDDRSAEATLSGTSLGGVTILPAIAYYSGEGASGDPLGSAPTAAGTYTCLLYTSSLPISPTRGPKSSEPATEPVTVQPVIRAYPA